MEFPQGVTNHMIHEVVVKNFKSLKDVAVTLGQRNVLVGPNLSGKSNLIGVFRFLTQMVSAAAGSYGLPNAIQSMGGFSEVAWKGSESGPISVGLAGEGRPFDAFGRNAKWEYRITFVGDEWGHPRVQEELLAVEGLQAFNLIETEGAIRKLKKRDGRQLSEVGDSNRSALEFEIPDWDGNALRRFFHSSQFHHLVPPLMRILNQSVATEFLLEHGGNLGSWLMTLQTKHGPAFERIARVARDAFPGLERLFTVPTQQGQVFLASPEKYLKRPVPVFGMSDGELAFIALLSLIFSPPELGAPLYCVEEPENHLHPRLLTTLVEVLKQVQEEIAPEDRAQIVITTHSPYLVDKFSLDELIVLEKREGATVPIRPSDKVHLRDLLEKEEIGLGELFYSGALSGD
jgi:predicted ATPase